MIDEYRSPKMLSYSKNVVISGSTITNVENRFNGSAFDQLQKYTAPGAFHNSGERSDPPRCHPNTRVVVLKTLMDWVMSTEESASLVMWLHGAAGAGKSAIAQTLAEKCHDLGVLLAGFFFGRSDSNRNHAGRLFPTLAYQIACAIPEIRDTLDVIIYQDPLIFTRSLEAQVMALVVRPLQSIRQPGLGGHPKHVPRLIIIDGLDECGDEKIQSALLDLIAHILRTQNIAVKFLISSRPNLAISHKFNSRTLEGLHVSLPLDLSNLYFASTDIFTFLDDKFTDIKRNHPLKRLIPSTWPPPDTVTSLRKKASGQFIYAAVAMKYISSLHVKPTHALEHVLGLHPTHHEMPFAELDSLFLHVLTSIKYKEQALAIIASVIFRPQFHRVSVVERFLHLEPGDVDIFLGDLSALINVKTDGFTATTIHIIHASFPDFLLDPRRSGPFHLNAQHLHTKFAIQMLGSYQPPLNRDCIPFCSPLARFIGMSYEKVKQLGILKHLPLALPTADIRQAILECPVLHVDMINPTDPPPPYLYSGYFGQFLPNYLNTIRNLDFADSEKIYTDLLCSFDNLLVHTLDVLSKNTHSTFFIAALALIKGLDVLQDDRWMSFIMDSSLDPFVEILAAGSSSTASSDILCSFLNDRHRSRHYVMDGQKYASAAVYCFGQLSDLGKKFPLEYTSNTKAQRNFPWRWKSKKKNYEAAKRRNGKSWKWTFKRRAENMDALCEGCPYPRVRDHWSNLTFYNHKCNNFLDILPMILHKARDLMKWCDLLADLLLIAQSQIHGNSEGRAARWMLLWQV